MGSMRNQKKYMAEPRPYVPSIKFKKPAPDPSFIETPLPMPSPAPLLDPTPEVIEIDPTPTHLDPLTPETARYLSSLPIHLRPVSPYLAALHDARIRLLSIQLRNPIRWCINCGSLRETTLRPAGIEAKGSDLPSPSPKKSRKSPKKSPAKPRAAPLGNCPACGEKFRRAKAIAAKDKAGAEVLAAFRPARAVRKSRRGMGAEVEPEVVMDVFMADEEGSAAVSSQGDGHIPMPPEEDDPMDVDPAPIPIPTPPTTTTPPIPKPPATPLAAPNLRYIPSTAPTPPSYIQPPAIRPPAATATIGGRPTPITSTGKAETEGAKRKKKKASGLAKLLAQSKEREEGDMGGKWGFG